MSTSVYLLPVKWNGTVYVVTLPPEALVRDLQEQLRSLTGVIPAHQKLAGHTKLLHARGTDQLFLTLGLTSGQKLMLIGTATEFPTATPSTPSSTSSSTTISSSFSTSETVAQPSELTTLAAVGLGQPPISTPWRQEKPNHPSRSVCQHTPLIQSRLQNAAKTKVLCLVNLSLCDIHSDVLSLHLDLAVLDLSKNLLAGFPSPAFENLRSLRILNLSCNRLDSYPISVSTLAFLEDLNLSLNLLKELPSSAFQHCSRLKHLDLSLNQLSSLPSDVFTTLNSTLITCNLRDNNLRQVCPSLLTLSLLTELDLDHNQLSTLIPEEKEFVTGISSNSLSSWNSLHCLALRENQIRALPKEIFLLSNLVELHIEGNPIQWSQLQSLDTYDVWKNRIERNAYRKFAC